MISVETAKSEIVDVIETIEKWIPMFEQGNAPAVLESVMDLLSSQQAEIERLKGKPVVPKQQSFGNRNYVCPVCSLVLDEARDTFCPSCGTEIAWIEIEEGEQE